MTAQSTIAYISIGSNIGNRVANCKHAVDCLAPSPSIHVLTQSRFYLTEPVDYLDQEWFVNAAVKVETRLDPFELLKTLKQIEEKIGRTSSSIRFGPRVLDMDIIFYSDSIIKTQNLVIPHPRMHNRCFILKPLCDIDPDIVHPVFKKSVQNLLAALDDPNQKVLPYKC